MPPSVMQLRALGASAGDAPGPPLCALTLAVSVLEVCIAEVANARPAARPHCALVLKSENLLSASSYVLV